MKRVLHNESNCLDIGCHKGEILDVLLKFSPSGSHIGFEPISHLYAELQKKYKGKAKIYPYALSDQSGKSTFQFVKNAPAYSGLQQRKYDIASPEIEEIEVEKKRLDDIIEDHQRIDFVKIDVEGGEFNVFKGAERTFAVNKPVIIFEFGLGAGDYYGTTPDELYDFVTSKTGLKISSLKSFVANGTPCTETEFIELFNSNKEYYFVAHP